MRTIDTAAVIERAKQLHGFTQDQELAKFLNVSRTSLASWKRRNSIPAKHLFQMVWGKEVTVDWLMYGEELAKVDEFGFTKSKPYVDPYILWLSLILYRMELSGRNEEGERLSGLLTDDELAYCHIYIGEFITTLTQAKDKWEKSGIVQGKDIYKAIATEFGLGLFDFPPVPWWEDEKII